MSFFGLLRKSKSKNLTLEEKWNLDIESYKNPNYQAKIGEKQCYKCVYKRIENGLHCEKFGEIPKDILFNSRQCELRKIKIVIKPMKSVNELKFGMTREQVNSLWGSAEQFQKSQFSNNLTDNYGYCHMYYDNNDLFEAVEIISNDLDIYYNDSLLSNKYSEILNFFKNIYDDIEEDDNGFISKKGSIGVYIENDVDKVDSILFGKENYYNYF